MVTKSGMPFLDWTLLTFPGVIYKLCFLRKMADMLELLCVFKTVFAHLTSHGCFPPREGGGRVFEPQVRCEYPGKLAERQTKC